MRADCDLIWELDENPAKAGFYVVLKVWPDGRRQINLKACWDGERWLASHVRMWAQPIEQLEML